MKKAFLLSLAIISVFSGNVLAQSNSGRITLESLWLYYEYYPQSTGEFRWMNDDQYYTVLEEDGKIAKYSIEEENKVSELLDITSLDLGGISTASVETYELSAGENKILLKADIESIYRHSTREVCFVADVATKEVRIVMGGNKVSNPTFSSDGARLGFVYENNLYYMDVKDGRTVQVTFDGKLNHIINGATDWVYEEEFAFAQGFAWSPDGNRIAYYRFDESEVRTFTMPLYGDLYPYPYEFKYPKAGEKNSDVSIHIYDISKESMVTARLGDENDQYIPRIKWTQNSDELAVMRMNRLQNELDMIIVNAGTGDAEVVLTEKSETYVEEVTDHKWHFLKDSDDFIWLSEMNGYNHIYLYGRDGKVKQAITSGKYEVSEFLGVDEENGLVYYTSKEVSPLEEHLYVVNLKGKKKKKLTEVSGVHVITFSSAFSYYTDNYSNTSLPPQTVLCNNKGNVLKTLEENKNLATKVSRLKIAEPEFFTFTTSEGVSLNGWMIKPADFDPSREYPVLMNVYGGPGDQQVLNEWGNSRPFNYIWYQMLAQNGYIVACVDNRGTGGRGRDFRAVTYGDLGKYETIDQIEAAKYLGGLRYVDASRIGIWGWSYGGYMTSLCLTKGNGVFKAGIAVAPVTNWRFYDTIYTERYLKTPQLNPEGYDENSPINFAANLQGAYLLVHGTGDDNVHVQNSMEWVNALVNANKQFDMFFYPNRNHGIYGGYTRYHLYKKMTDFLLENL